MSITSTKYDELHIQTTKAVFHTNPEGTNADMIGKRSAINSASQDCSGCVDLLSAKVEA